MLDTSGFYKLDNKSLLFAPNWVQSKDYTLVRAEQDKYTYPVDGWSWYDNAADAYTANNLPMPNAGDIAIDTQNTSTADWAGFEKSIMINMFSQNE